MSGIDLSVVLVTSSSYRRLRKTVRRLAAQDIADRLQLILVCRNKEGFEIEPSDVRGLGLVTVVEAGEFDSTGRPRAFAIPEAQAPVTVFAEDHCFPSDGWARALISGHGSGPAAVGPVMHNANLETALSWADMALNFGPSSIPSTSGPTSLLCWHNTSYRTDLLKRTEDLARMLEAEGVFFRQLERQGETLLRSTDARVEHLNLSRFESFIGGQFWGTRLFWSTLVAAERWPWTKRLFFTAAAPAVALRRLLRGFADLSRIAPTRVLAAAPYLLAGSIAIGLGAIAGLLRGSGNCMHHRMSLELERERHLKHGEERILFDWSS